MVEILLVKKIYPNFSRSLGFRKCSKDVNQSLDDLKSLKEQLQKEKDELEDKREELVSLRALAQIQNRMFPTKNSKTNC